MTHFYDPRQFAFAEPLGRNWQAIRAEYEGIRDRTIDWVEKELYDKGWKVFPLFGFPQGEAIAEHIDQCPLTAAIVREHVPRHGSAGFSVLEPMTRIKPHRGYQGEFLRIHLGLKIPAGDCGLEVEGERRTWRAGEVLIFDDRLLHEAWNATGQERVVLLIDFVPA
jgi:beta-hydroxylase